MISTFSTPALAITIGEEGEVSMKNSQKYRWDDLFRSTFLWGIVWPKRWERKHPLPSYWQRFHLAWQWNLVRKDLESLIFNQWRKDGILRACRIRDNSTGWTSRPRGNPNLHEVKENISRKHFMWINLQGLNYFPQLISFLFGKISCWVNLIEAIKLILIFI